METDNRDEIVSVEETAIEESDKETGEETAKKNYPLQASLTIRAIVGGYVLYLAYQIITSKSEISPWMWVAVGVFVIAGCGLVIMSVKHFICGEYIGGKKDENH